MQYKHINDTSTQVKIYLVYTMMYIVKNDSGTIAWAQDCGEEHNITEKQCTMCVGAGREGVTNIVDYSKFIKI